ncbi:MAG: 4a-hydroxytetrahydrobiopterin dehydratase [Acidobacteriota bacterium]|nr:4a-hydroxytetrahydrobiopterin dehydratase [Thermoanaerobaculaceae bacterium]
MILKELLPYIEKELENFKDWKASEKSITKAFIFDSHINALKFVEAVSLEAISRESFPEIKLSYEKVELAFFSENDSDVFKQIDFIKKIEQFCDCYGLKFAPEKNI